MRRLIQGMLLLGCCVLGPCNCLAQEIRVEIFAGHENPSLDVFWVEPIGEASPWLFLSRNTFSLPEYEIEQGNFSTLNIAAYQIKKTGLGLALAASANSNLPLQGRAGVQFLKGGADWLFYSILSSKLGEDADARCLAIAQYTPRLGGQIKQFYRIEWVTSMGFQDAHRFSASLVRAGLQVAEWQFGLGGDFLWTGSGFANQTSNFGVFLTHLF